MILSLFHPTESSDDSPNRHKRKSGHSAETKQKIDGLQSVLQHYVLTSHLASEWCINKVQQTLAQDSIDIFLLVTQSDLKVRKT